MSDPDRAAVGAPVLSLVELQDQNKTLADECRAARQAIMASIGPPMKHLYGGRDNMIAHIDAVAPSFIARWFRDTLDVLDEWERLERAALAAAGEAGNQAVDERAAS